MGAETFSRILDWTDRAPACCSATAQARSCWRRSRSSAAATTTGVLSTRICSDGRFEELLYVDGGPGSTKTTGHLRMNGREVFRHAVQRISGVIGDPGDERLRSDEVDLYVPHHANSASSTASPITYIPPQDDRYPGEARRHVGASSRSPSTTSGPPPGRGTAVLMEAIGRRPD